MSTLPTQAENSAIEIDAVRQVVRQSWGYDSFRPLQQEAIECVLAGRDSVVVLPTGGGKSLCFQAPACCLEGLAVVVSPLISLMKDQVDSLRTNGIAAAFFNSSLTPRERNDVIEAIRSDSLKLLYLAPESLLTENVLSLLAGVKISMFAIDEAHCISSWGHDFRPEYRGLRTLKQRFPNVAVHTYTATATERVRHDIATELALDQPAMLVGSFDRPNLNYRIQRRNRGMDQMLEVIERHHGESGIVYCISRKEVEKTAAALNALGHSAVAYHAGLSDTDRIKNQEAFLEERIDIVVATVAFGMGIDKSNVRFVIHTGMPKSLEAYQQESGRAGRDGLEADCCLFFGGGDFGTWKRLMAYSGEVTEAALESLQAIDRFCNSTRCRHKSLVEHFGQTLDQQECQACDICLDQVEQVDDPLIVAQKILSCVIRLEQMYGADYTAQVLAGSNDQRILEKRHDQLSTHGILGEYPKGAIRDWIEQLISQDCAQKIGEYNQLQVTELGWQVLRGEHTPTLLKPASKSSDKKSQRSQSVDPASWEGVDRPLFESLRDLRREIATEQGVPAYIVFGDAALRDMARRRPSTQDDFLQVQGVGQKKCEDYAEPFLSCINDYCTTNSLPTDVTPTALPSTPTKPRRPAKTASAVAAFPYFKEGKTVAQVAEEMGRAESTVYGYLDIFLRHEQITDPSPWIDEATATRIRQAIEAVGNEKLKPIFEHLDSEVPYHQIRIVAACLANAE
ncbi:MAG: DNA helicase RecQ [Planctomycetes bacterium]|nr:DNA helicase RecQ [Planctomycetota bacterium]